MKKIILFVVVAMLTLLAACNEKSTGTNDKEKKDNKLTVYTTVYPLTYFTERIGGDAVTVSSIYPAGANEHTFEPTQKDMMKLADADLFFYIGLGLEGFVDNAKETLKDENVKFVATSNMISDEELAMSTGHDHDHEAEATTETTATADEHDHEAEATTETTATADEHDHEAETTTEETDHSEHDHSGVDPHVWLSPTLSKELALSIKDELVDLLPDQKEELTANYEKLIGDLDGLDQKFTDLASTAETKTFFVSHAAFGYIAGQYGLEQVAIAGLNSQSEPSQKELADLVDLAKELNIHTIMFEQNVSSKLAETIQNEVGADSAVLHNLGVLTQDDIDNDETYFTLMNKNVETLKDALNSKK